MKADPFPWARLMQLGLGRLRLPPEQFWRSTPRELIAALGLTPSRPLLRQDLLELMKAYPDE